MQGDIKVINIRTVQAEHCKIQQMYNDDVRKIQEIPTQLHYRIFSRHASTLYGQENIRFITESPTQV